MSPRRATLVATLSLLGAAAFTTARAASALIDVALASSASAPPRPLDVPRGPVEPPLHRTVVDERASLRAIGAPEPAVRDAPADPADPGSARPCERLRVVASAVYDDPAGSFVVLATPDGPSVTRRRGEAVGDLRVVAIEPARAWLEGPRGLCQAGPDWPAAPQAGAPAPPGSSTSSAPPLVRSVTDRIRNVGPGVFEIDRATLDVARERYLELLPPRAVPDVENGRPVGYRIVAVRPDSPLGVLGLRAGDRIERVNGMEVSTPEGGLAAYARFATADIVRLVLRRDGKPTEIELRVK